MDLMSSIRLSRCLADAAPASGTRQPDARIAGRPRAAFTGILRRAAARLAAALLALVASGTLSAQELRLAMSSEPSSMDPHYHNLFSNINVSEHVFESLIKLDQDSRIVPGLAESWRLVDPTTWELKLRKGAKFHDGSDLTAEDVVFSLDRPAQVPNSPGPFTLYTRQIVAKEIVDPQTVRLKTATPYPLMLNDLTTIYVVSKKNVQGITSEDFATGKGMVGTGPFRFVAFKRGDRVELARNDAYWGGPPAWEKVTMRFIAADPTRIAALLSGDVDAIENVPTADLPKIRNNANLAFFQKVSHRVIYFTLDQGRDQTPFVTDKAGKPLDRNPFKDLRVRQAVDRAINRQAISERVMEGLSLPTANLVPAPMFGNNPALKVTPYDADGAKKLLADAGYPDGFALTIHGPNNRYVNDDQILQAVAQMLARAGIQTKVEAMPLATFFRWTRSSPRRCAPPTTRSARSCCRRRSRWRCRTWVSYRSTTSSRPGPRARASPTRRVPTSACTHGISGRSDADAPGSTLPLRGRGPGQGLSEHGDQGPRFPQTPSRCWSSSCAESCRASSCCSRCRSSCSSRCTPSAIRWTS